MRSVGDFENGFQSSGDFGCGYGTGDDHSVVLKGQNTGLGANSLLGDGPANSLLGDGPANSLLGEGPVMDYVPTVGTGGKSDVFKDHPILAGVTVTLVSSFIIWMIRAYFSTPTQAVGTFGRMSDSLFKKSNPRKKKSHKKKNPLTSPMKITRIKKKNGGKVALSVGDVGELNFMKGSKGIFKTKSGKDVALSRVDFRMDPPDGVIISTNEADLFAKTMRY